MALGAIDGGDQDVDEIQARQARRESAARCARAGKERLRPPEPLPEDRSRLVQNQPQPVTPARPCRAPSMIRAGACPAGVARRLPAGRNRPAA